MKHNLLAAPFTWATGIEDTFIQHARPRLRALDEYELTQHYKLWKSDIDLVAETGVQAVRWGIPWHIVQPAPDQWDWEWTDRALEHLVTVKGITPILDLMHYGTPIWLDNSFINSSYPQRVADYAAAVVARYKSLVRYYTPLNEPMVNASMSGFKGEWPPYLSGDDGYVKMALALSKGIVLTTQAIKDEQPDAVTVQVEALWHTFTRDESLKERAARANARQFLCFDLTTGRVDDKHALAEYLHEHGAAASELDWFRRNYVSFDIFGANYYPWSHAELRMRADGKPGTVVRRTSGHKIEIVLRDAWERYHMPLMITETSSNGDVKARARWMDETLETVCSLREEGIPIIGYTWFPLFTMVDWSYRKGRLTLDKYLIHLGLYDSALDTEGVLRRHETPLVKRFQNHMATPMPPVARPVLETSRVSPRSRLSLDGQWYFSLTEILSTADCLQITVPAPWQADARFRDHIGEAWYMREFEVPADWLAQGRALVLGFGAVDYFADVWLNGIKVGAHEGGYLPFELDITAAARTGKNVLKVRVQDPLETFPEVPHGKQSWYGMLSGIWQSVWVESRSVSHIQRVKISSSGDQVEIHVFTSSGMENRLVDVQILAPDGGIVGQTMSRMDNFTMHVGSPLTWSPEQPNLYRLQVKLTAPIAGSSTPATPAMELLDEVTETFGFRTIETRDGRILLNGRPFYMRSALDQDYYPELICTPPSQEYIEDQFRKAKEMGLNSLRVHIKVADPRYYAAADKIGLLIWTELPNHTLLTENAKRRARETLAGMLERDGNHPSIGIWTIMNESWGIDLTDPAQRAWLSETYLWFKQLDPTRLVVGNSACWSNFHVVTDIADFHMYYDLPDNYDKWMKWTETYARRPWWLFAHEYTEHARWREFVLDPWSASQRPTAAEVMAKGDEPLVVSEFGNWGLPDVQKLYEGNGGAAPWWFDSGLDWSGGVVYPRGIEQRFREYHLNLVFPSLSALTEASQRLQYEALKFQIENLRSHASLQGYVITELTDVHWESNGLLDMYRNPKTYYPLLNRLNADDVLIPLPDRVNYWAGEAGAMKISFSHYSPLEIEDAVLHWEVLGEDGIVSSGQRSVGACSSFDVTDLGILHFETPRAESPSTARVEIKLFQGEDLIASTDQEIYLFPQLVPSGAGQQVYAPELKTSLEKLGYAITDDLSRAAMAVVTVLDDSLREFTLRGGRVLLLAESEDALQMHIPHLDIKEREETVWQGDWANSFGWHRFDNLPTGGIVNFAFAGLTPELVIRNFSSREFAFNVYAGMFVGWLHKPVPTIARRRAGQGEVLVSTFRLSKNLEMNPLAMCLFAELVRLVQAPQTEPVLTLSSAD
ncbi:MAG TPA: family 1 glycosylhydrolase [Anaerolineales bacterium]|nr:family 1 glycosylhydrolase [Anaerolineales bacterium]